MQCGNNLKQLGLAAHNYHAAIGCFPPGLNQFQFNEAPQYRGTSVFVFLLPYLEQVNIADRWNYDFPLENTEGGPDALAATVVPSFVCPSDTIAENPYQNGSRYDSVGSYGGNGGSRSFYPDFATVDGIFHTTGPASHPEPNQQSVAIGEVGDGTSNTLLFGERYHRDQKFESFAAIAWAGSLNALGKWSAIGGKRRIGDVTMSAHAPINWLLPFDYGNVGSANPPINSARDFAQYEDLRICAYGSGHSGGANFVMADGSVRFVSESIAQEQLRALSTRAGGEVVEGP